MGELGTGAKLIGAFVALIIGIALISSVADEVADRTTKEPIVNEVHSLTNAYGAGTGLINTTDTDSNKTVTNNPTGWKVQDCPIAGVVVTNSSGSTLTVSTDYRVFDSSGIIQFLNTDATNWTNFGSNGKNNNSLVTYTYCKDGYMNLSWGRTTLNTTVGLFAIGLLMVAVGLFYSVGKDVGII